MNSTMQISPISDDKIIGKPLNVEQQEYHPSGVFVLHHYLCYNPTIPVGIETQTRSSENEIISKIRQLVYDKIIIIAITGKFKPRRGAMIIEMEKIVNPKTRRVDMIMGEDMMCAPKPQRSVRIIKVESHISTKTQRVDMIIALAAMGKSKPRRGAMIIEMEKIVNPKTRRVDMIIENEIISANKPPRGEMIIGKQLNVDQQKYHPSGVFVHHHNIFYNHTIRQKRIENQTRQLAKDTTINFTTNY